MYYTYSDYLKNKYHEKVYKLPVNLPVTCPNRLNGACGCDFCAEQGTGFEALNPQLSVTEQLTLTREKGYCQDRTWLMFLDEIFKYRCIRFYFQSC